jgi:hypothetical protein
VQDPPARVLRKPPRIHPGETVDLGSDEEEDSNPPCVVEEGDNSHEPPALLYPGRGVKSGVTLEASDVCNVRDGHMVSSGVLRVLLREFLQGVEINSDEAYRRVCAQSFLATDTLFVERIIREFEQKEKDPLTKRQVPLSRAQACRKWQSKAEYRAEIEGKRFVLVPVFGRSKMHYTLVIVCLPVDEASSASYGAHGALLYLDPEQSPRVPLRKARALLAWVQACIDCAVLARLEGQPSPLSDAWEAALLQLSDVPNLNNAQTSTLAGVSGSQGGTLNCAFWVRLLVDKWIPTAPTWPANKKPRMGSLCDSSSRDSSSAFVNVITATAGEAAALRSQMAQQLDAALARQDAYDALGIDGRCSIPKLWFAGQESPSAVHSIGNGECLPYATVQLLRHLGRLSLLGLPADHALVHTQSASVNEEVLEGCRRWLRSSVTGAHVPGAGKRIELVVLDAALAAQASAVLLLVLDWRVMSTTGHRLYRIGSAAHPPLGEVLLTYDVLQMHLSVIVWAGGSSGAGEQPVEAFLRCASIDLQSAAFLTPSVGRMLAGGDEAEETPSDSVESGGLGAMFTPQVCAP